MTDSKFKLEAMVKIDFVYGMSKKALNRYCPQGMGLKLDRSWKLLYNFNQLKNIIWNVDAH